MIASNRTNAAIRSRCLRTIRNMSQKPSRKSHHRMTQRTAEIQLSLDTSCWSCLVRIRDADGLVSAPAVESGTSDFIVTSDTPPLLQSLLRFFPAVLPSVGQAMGILLGRITRNLVNKKAQWATASLFTGFLDHTQLHTTLGRNPLDKRSARRRDLYLTTHDTQKRQISMPPVEFEPTISACERSQAAPLLRSWVLIPPGAWIFVSFECRVLSGRGLCDELITHPEESYRMCGVVVCDLGTSRIGVPYIYIYIYIWH
jgi:hypothetical protein